MKNEREFDFSFYLNNDCAGSLNPKVGNPEGKKRTKKKKKRSAATANNNNKKKSIILLYKTMNKNIV